MYEVAIKILKEMDELGYESYIIGGYPRNLLLGKEVTDIDLCTSASPDILKKKYEIINDYSKFGSLRIKKENFIFEITTFRIELKYNNRYPQIEYTKNILDDLKRRDFTINTLCIDKDGKMIDFLGAKKDIEDKMIKCIGDIDKKINEDPIRILRAIRFASEFDFQIEENLFLKIKQYSYLIKKLSTNQIEKEISKMNKKGIELLKEIGYEEVL